MISLLLRAIAFILFLIVGFNGTLFNHAGSSLVAFGLAAWVLATLLGGYGPPSPLVKNE